jgi:hypothetical protein
MQPCRGRQADCQETAPRKHHETSPFGSTAIKLRASFAVPNWNGKTQQAAAAG